MHGLDTSFYKEIFEQIDTGAIITDKNRVVVSVNSAFLTLSGYKGKEVCGFSIDNFIDGYQFHERNWRKNIILKKKNHVKISQWLLLNQINTGSAENDPFYIWVMTDFQICGLDPLTKLPNRFLFNQKLNETIEQAREESGTFAILFIDLDRFKFINDTLGHAAGDQLLLESTLRIQDVIGSQHILARMGGDEFVCVLTNLKTEVEAEYWARKVIKAFSTPFLLKEMEFYISTSIGISVYPYDGDDGDTLISNADSAMYRAKKKGRNRYENAKVEMNAGGFEKFLIENHLHKAIENNELILYFQPQINLSSNKVLSFEALIRWNHPDFGLISPGDFIPIAEETGLILPIGDWVLKEACLKMREWQNAGYSPVRVAVNLSAGQFLQNDFVHKVKNILGETLIDPACLELEITENMVMHDVNQAIKSLMELKKLGVQISIDDFGTGYSSLNYLKEFPIDTLKIDRSFICDLDTNSSSVALTRAITNLAHDLNLKVVAEGVENLEQLTIVKQQSCDAVQGYYFSKPIDDTNVLQFLKKEHNKFTV
ncbi:sensor domain-containing protein [Mesobacillus maritimus]|uniref:EAL domain-containing protein n=1 Tax=Mesobacillus maritimus TaxID=1643336 RepID=A0ABS7K380_9BACI|nr:EAL domain-containing protein [Mesobacillus maritimus]MBY0096685.1 EAL domain-containing protein [Mesobacillus maritimus]